MRLSTELATASLFAQDFVCDPASAVPCKSVIAKPESVRKEEDFPMQNDHLPTQTRDEPREMRPNDWLFSQERILPGDSNNGNSPHGGDGCGVGVDAGPGIGEVYQLMPNATEAVQLSPAPDYTKHFMWKNGTGGLHEVHLVCLAAWLPGCLAAWPPTCLAAWLPDGWLAGWLDGCLLASDLSLSISPGLAPALQVWYDDMETLSVKMAATKQIGLRGVGMWTSDATRWNASLAQEMWAAVPAPRP
jgi:hypothetical protein